MAYSVRTKVTVSPDLANRVRVPVIIYYNHLCSDQWRQSAHNYQHEYVNEHAASENKAVANAATEIMECFRQIIQNYKQTVENYNVTASRSAKNKLISSDLIYFDAFVCMFS